MYFLKILNKWTGLFLSSTRYSHVFGPSSTSQFTITLLPSSPESRRFSLNKVKQRRRRKLIFQFFSNLFNQSSSLQKLVYIYIFLYFNFLLTGPNIARELLKIRFPSTLRLSFSWFCFFHFFVVLHLTISLNFM